MQYAKKLMIVDPRLLDQLQVDRECKHIQRPANIDVELKCQYE